ncbi:MULTISPECIES: cell division protein FtsI [Silvimonas]|uniref:cell division protein FtsI n=1 Tax=Silvimonas TaxID=300264 RepID=UPI0024B3A634|nr:MULTISPECIES: cell division protein FtsI [Silvimonas]MDR3426617.1 cell division protein FtsI [Silvimonas sp.]
MSLRSWAQVVVPLVITLGLSGCVVVPTFPLGDAISATADGIATVVSVAPSFGSNSPFEYVRPYLSLKEVCIDWNEVVSVPDFVPSLQVLLKRYGVESRVYSPGSAPAGCAQLTYTATRKWERRWGNDEDSAYLAAASLVLRRNGQLLGSATYESGNYGFDKWKNTGAKLAPVVDTLLAGN